MERPVFCRYGVDSANGRAPSSALIQSGRHKKGDTVTGVIVSDAGDIKKSTRKGVILTGGITDNGNAALLVPAALR